MNLQTNWHRVPVTLYRGSWNFGTPVAPENDPYLARIPLFVKSVSVEFATANVYQLGNPKDWITRIPRGGTVTCRGIMMPTAVTIPWFTAIFWDRIVMEGYNTFQSCRPVSQSLSVESIAGDVTVLHGNYSFSFELHI